MKIKNLIAFAVIIMFILPTTNVFGKEPFISNNKQKNLTVNLGGLDGEGYSIQIEISNEEFENLSKMLNDTLINIARATKFENSPDGKNISDSEWNQVKNDVNCIIDFIKKIVGDDFPNESIKAEVADIIKSLQDPTPLGGPIYNLFYLCRQPLLSIGVGYTWIPHYDYETFLGKMLRPIFMRHVIGFSATFPIFKFGFVYWYFGFQRVWTFLFRGLHINFGDLGIDRLFGPQILIGYGFFPFIHQ
ncbi:MAG: hypothetical protein ACQXXF_06930 [Thermoplasmatota archaeon]|jgi:hypothetical protein